MGRDKMLLEVGGRTLPRRVAEVLFSCCEEVLVVGGPAGLVPGAGRAPDERPGRCGPLAGIEAGLAGASAPVVFVAAGDMPFLDVRLVRHLLDRVSRRDLPAAVPAYGGREHPLCAAYRTAMLPRVRAALDGGRRSVRAFLRNLPGVEYVDEEALRRLCEPELALMNVNAPEDLARARTAAGP